MEAQSFIMRLVGRNPLPSTSQNCSLELTFFSKRCLQTALRIVDIAFSTGDRYLVISKLCSRLETNKSSSNFAHYFIQRRAELCMVHMMPRTNKQTNERFDDVNKWSGSNFQNACGFLNQQRSVGKLRCSFLLLVACFLLGPAQASSPSGAVENQHKYLRRSLQVTSTEAPTDRTTEGLTTSPTVSPTVSPTAIPTKAATGDPTSGPTGFPTPFPTTLSPTNAPSPIPTTGMPSAMPVTPGPTPVGTFEPTAYPSPLPTVVPTPAPTVMPVTPVPTPSGTLEPTMAATMQPTIEPTRATSSDSSLITFLDGETRDMAVIIVSAVGGAVVIIVIGIFIFLYRRRRARKSLPPKNKKGETMQSVPKKQEPTTEPQNRPSLDSSPSKYGGLQAEIMLNPEDDISTLGDPTVVTNIRSREALEMATERFEVQAPAGKLGMVIATHGSLPVVHAMEPSSVLADRVRIGDVLLSIDGIYCTGKAAVDVSRLIGKKSNQPARHMVFARSRYAPNEM
eukprot:Nitzschia sp. Nitz4//scaffold235_size30605//16350//17964//NITZ4_007976-RA/size30605-augustus-gene-0.18-mRNA-1//-1//CDS//3329543456//7545//frame0